MGDVDGQTLREPVAPIGTYGMTTADMIIKRRLNFLPNLAVLDVLIMYSSTQSLHSPQLSQTSEVQPRVEQDSVDYG